LGACERLICANHDPTDFALVLTACRGETGAPARWKMLAWLAALRAKVRDFYSA
jgi:hypothetical protein